MLQGDEQQRPRKLFKQEDSTDIYASQNRRHQVLEQAYHYQANQEYYSLDSFLCEEQTFPLLFHVHVPVTGHLSAPQGHLRQIPSGTRMNVPSHTVTILCGMQLCQPYQLPFCYSQKIQQDMRADAMSVSLNRLQFYYYQFGRRCARLVEGALQIQLLDFLLNTFLIRVPHVIRRAQVVPHGLTTPFYQSLAWTEREVYSSSAFASLSHQAEIPL